MAGRERVGQDSILTALPGLSGKSVLVVGCGDGHYPRLFRRAGASRVMGVDGSQELIAIAQRAEERDPLGISYEVHATARLPRMGVFDFVTVAWPAGSSDIDAIVARLSPNLKPGARLVILSPLPELEAAFARAGYRVLESDQDLLVLGL
ncbi:Methyltransferase domain-containing protein [Amycolatopsis xylanica]|uniref:Methyltransferase domain-containing protein n=1 Tax=Amycolatopsis xylanica TaxID=589385 RepID=A0A1H3Q4S1_9PSEU|nr:class I SAM-dependent methyltransferase [Amycolatopsis xylanica]SDZ08230.1 Methyltransferase domain-containing protein [Amycolatopsis xylanica]